MSGGGSEDRSRARSLMMAALDGEIAADERAELERLLAAEPELRAEWQSLGKVKEVTHTMNYRKPPDETWDHYFESVYNRLERGLGWTLVSLGTIALAGYALWELVQALLADTELPALVKLGVFALLLGGVILLVSVVRERLFTRRSDPYRGIQR